MDWNDLIVSKIDYYGQIHLVSLFAKNKMAASVAIRQVGCIYYGDQTYNQQTAVWGLDANQTLFAAGVSKRIQVN